MLILIIIFNGGNIQRLFRLSFLIAFLGILMLGEGIAQIVYVSGRIAPGDVRIFQKDSTYIIDRDYVVGGTLIIEPGTKVKFYPNGGRIIDSVGGRIIADGLAQTTYNPNPDGIDPIGTPYSPSNPFGFSGYADLDYFLYEGSEKTIDVNTERDVTVNPDKYDYIFNVILDMNYRQISNFAFYRDIEPDDHRRIPVVHNRIMVPYNRVRQFHLFSE